MKDDSLRVNPKKQPDWFQSPCGERVVKVEVALKNNNVNDVAVSIPLRGKGCESLFQTNSEYLVKSFNPLAGKGL